MVAYIGIVCIGFARTPNARIQLRDPDHLRLKERDECRVAKRFKVGSNFHFRRKTKPFPNEMMQEFSLSLHITTNIRNQLNGGCVRGLYMCLKNLNEKSFCKGMSTQN